jgi:peptide/nickel transport system permease protein
MLIVVTFVFLVLRITGDPAEEMLPDDATDEEYEEFRQQWGLDRPLYEQYAVYILNIFKGNFGKSYQDNRDVRVLIGERLPKTLYLMITSICFSLIISIPLGVYSSLHRNSFGDRSVMALAVFGFSMPNFFFGIILILIFSMHLKMLPSAGSDTWAHLIMPVLTGGLSRMGSYSRFTRSAMLSVMNKPFIRTAVAKGASRNQVVYGHALPNAAIPIVTIVGTSIGGIVAGSVIIETIFAWPGIGRLLVSSVASRDLAVVQAVVLILSLCMVLANLCVDLLYGVLDPRIRIKKEG